MTDTPPKRIWARKDPDSTTGNYGSWYVINEFLDGSTNEYISTPSLAADPMKFIKLKPLLWVERQAKIGRLFQAESDFGVFEVKGNTGFYAALDSGIISKVLKDIPSAKAAAEAHRREMFTAQIEGVE